MLVPFVLIIFIIGFSISLFLRNDFLGTNSKNNHDISDNILQVKRKLREKIKLMKDKKKNH